MSISNYFSGSIGRLKEVHFKNCIDTKNPSESQIEVFFEDSFSNYTLTESELTVLYTRKMYNTPRNLEISATFELSAQLNEGVTATLEELIEAINQEKTRFVAFAPAEISLLIGNIMKTAGFPAIITKPSFIEEDDNN